MDLNIRKIRSFITVAQLRSFRRAAEALYLSAPALSSQVRELEEALGVRLLYRTTRSVGLTAEGERFLARVKGPIESLDAIVKDLKDEADFLRGRVVIASVPTLASSLIPQAIAEFKKQFPGIAVHLLDVSAGDMIECVGNLEADLGVGPFSANSNDFDFTYLLSDPFVAVVSSDHQLAKRRELRLVELTTHPFIGLRTGDSVRLALERAFESIGHTLTPEFNLFHHYSIGGMVQAGLGVTALPSMAVPLLNFPNLRMIPIVDPVVTRDIGIIQRKGGGASPAATAFLRTVECYIDRFVSQLRHVSPIRRRAGARRRIASGRD